MKRVLASTFIAFAFIVLLAAFAVRPAVAAQDKPKAEAPTLTADQKLQLADSLTNLIEAQSELERLPGYSDYFGKVQAAQRNLTGLQGSVCKATNGKNYRLDRTVDPASGKVEWSCKEVPAGK